MLILVYVDNLILTRNNETKYAQFKKYLHSCLHIKDLGDLHYFLGLEVYRNEQGIFLN